MSLGFLSLNSKLQKNFSAYNATFVRNDFVFGINRADDGCPADILLAEVKSPTF